MTIGESCPQILSLRTSICMQVQAHLHTQTPTLLISLCLLCTLVKLLKLPCGLSRRQKFTKNFLASADHRSVSFSLYLAVCLNATYNPLSSSFISEPFIYALPVRVMCMSRSHVQAFGPFLKQRGCTSGMECVGEEKPAGTGQLILTLRLCRCYTFVLPGSFLLVLSVSFFITSPLLLFQLSASLQPE